MFLLYHNVQPLQVRSAGRKSVKKGILQFQDGSGLCIQNQRKIVQLFSFQTLVGPKTISEL